MPIKKSWLWIAWSVLILLMTAYLTNRLLGPDRRAFLPGKTTSGHYQIEMSCNACHTPWMSVKEKACYDCHAAEMKAANDSHPKSKFTDPRNADRLKQIAADNCVTCHREHVPDQTRAMGVTMPDDYCYFCHQETLKDVPSHKNFAFNSCAVSGCHNFHDNTALYRDFLLKHAEEAKIKDSAAVPKRDLIAFLTDSGVMKRRTALDAKQADAPRDKMTDQKMVDDWAATAHARAGVNCDDCHMVTDKESTAKHWEDKPGYKGCERCHSGEAEGFLGGKHGMRLAQNLPPMQPAMARLPMKTEAGHRKLGCASCHGAHDFNTRKAAVDSCLECHKDPHSRAYRNSSHFGLWKDELSGKGATGTGVSCATCHLPRVPRENDATHILVQHNQNLNLRPNEKMIRAVCLNCHGLAFSIDALADEKLVQNNFAGRPKRHVESIDMAVRRQVELHNHPTTDSKNNP